MTTDTTPEIPEGRTSAPVAELPPGAFLMSFTGFDEIAVAAHFGAKVQDLRDDPITLGRALVFVHHRRAHRDQGVTDKDAYAAAMGLTMTQVTEYFPPEADTDDGASAEGN